MIGGTHRGPNRDNGTLNKDIGLFANEGHRGGKLSTLEASEYLQLSRPVFVAIVRLLQIPYTEIPTSVRGKPARFYTRQDLDLIKALRNACKAGRHDSIRLTLQKMGV